MSLPVARLLNCVHRISIALRHLYRSGLHPGSSLCEHLRFKLGKVGVSPHLLEAHLGLLDVAYQDAAVLYQQ